MRERKLLREDLWSGLTKCVKREAGEAAFPESLMLLSFGLVFQLKFSTGGTDGRGLRNSAGSGCRLYAHM